MPMGLDIDARMANRGNTGGNVWPRTGMPTTATSPFTDLPMTVPMPMPMPSMPAPTARPPMPGVRDNMMRPRLPQRPPLTGPRNDLYGGYTSAQLLANPALVSRLGRPAAARWQARTPSAPPGSTGPMPQGPLDTEVITPSPTPSSPPSGPPFMPGADGRPIGAPPLPSPPTGPPGGMPASGVNEFLDPMMMFLSAVPAMRMNTTRSISDAMAQAGGTGNRWGTSAQRTAGQIGAEAGMQENAMLQSLLADYANRSEDRALQATGQATGLGALLDQMAQSRVNVPFGVGQYEQGRQDDIQRLLFNDFQANRLGWLGPMLQAAMSQGAGSPGSPGQIINVPNNDSERGAVDWLTLLAGFL